jgi:hypothetical protein
MNCSLRGAIFERYKINTLLPHPVCGQLHFDATAPPPTHPYQYLYTAAAKLIYIKLPMYLFFYMALGLNELMGTNPLLGQVEELGIENLLSLPFQDPKKSRSSGPTPSKDGPRN